MDGIIYFIVFEISPFLKIELYNSYEICTSLISKEFSNESFLSFLIISLSISYASSGPELYIKADKIAVYIIIASLIT